MRLLKQAEPVEQMNLKNRKGHLELSALLLFDKYPITYCQ